MPDYSASPVATSTAPQNKLIIEQLPVWAQSTEQIQKYFSDVIQHWFTPENKIKLDGYIGKQYSANSYGKKFIKEDTNIRDEFQLQPVYVSNSSSSILGTQTYTDLVRTLKYNGCITDIHKKIFDENYYNWAPPINPDMLLNYSNYYWDTENSDGILKPDYIVQEKDSIDGNLWSEQNFWYNTVETISSINGSITSALISSGRFVQAKRPIIEYKKNIQLVDFGRYKRTPVDLVSTLLLPEEIMFKTTSDNIKIDNEYLQDGDRILFTCIKNPGENNRVYKVVFKTINNVVTYALELDSSEFSSTRLTGDPVQYDTMRVYRGTIFKNSVLYWNGTEWHSGQQKTKKNQYPSFNLYDSSGVSFLNYTNTSFSGTPLFSFKESSTAIIDSVLGIGLSVDSNSSIQYVNNISNDTITYYQDLVKTTYNLKKFYTVIDDGLYTDWLKSKTTLDFTVGQTFVIDDINTKTFTVGASDISKVKVDINGTMLTKVTDGTSYSALNQNEFSVSGNVITLKYNVEIDDAVRVEFITNSAIDETLCSYVVSKNLKNNPLNNEVGVVSESELSEHFHSIIQNQDSFSGSITGINNYNSTTRDMSVGGTILQHEASLVPLLVSTLNDNLNIFDAIDFVRNAYNRFMNKFNQQVQNLTLAQVQTANADNIITTILNTINVGKSDSFAFWLSTVGSSTNSVTYIPPTPQVLGILPVQVPKIRVQKTINGSTALYNISHTGTISKAYSSLVNNVVYQDFRDDVIYTFERNVYNSINTKFTSNDYLPLLSKFDVQPGVFRSTSYSSSEWNTINLRSFIQWAISNSIDYKSNSNYNSSDWTTWNYSSCTYSANDSKSKGNWKGIYLDYFDTITPHTTPWEMFGFSFKPQWWDSYYTSYVIVNSEKVYIDNNIWLDAETGTIRSGDRAGIDSRFARPNITKYNPITSSGLLVSPFLAVDSSRIALLSSQPSIANQSNDWDFGDIGDVEYAFMNSNFASFNLALSLLKAKPARFCSYFFNTDKFSVIDGQYLNTSETREFFNSNTVVHGENNTTNTGYQVWISDYLKNKHINISTYFGSVVRGSNVQLMHKIGGYTKNENITSVSDSFGLVPSENQAIKLVKSSIMYEEVLSGIKVTNTADGFVITGYDILNPRFNYFEPSKTGSREVVKTSLGSYIQYNEYFTNVHELQYGSVIKSIQDVFSFITGYGQYLVSAGWLFEDVSSLGTVFNWNTVGVSFIDWAQGSSEGDFVTFSPCTKAAKFSASHGFINSIAQFSAGAWTLLDDNESGIGTNEISVSRIGSILSVRINDSVDKRMMLIRASVSEYEHAIIYDNTTIFNNNIYLPLYGLHQSRFKIYGTITGSWNGRLEAPGFMLVDNSIIPNFEKLVNDFSGYYNSSDPTSSVKINELSRHLIGFQTRTYLSSLIVNDASQVDFYRGYIKDKGTVQSFTNALRVSKDFDTTNYKVLEEWAFKVGEYGDVNNIKNLEFMYDETRSAQSPRMITFNESATADDISKPYTTYYGASGADSRWLTRSESNLKFPVKSKLSLISDYLSAGPYTTDEVDVVTASSQTITADRLAYYSNTGSLPQTIWLVNEHNKWDLWKIQNTGLYLTSITSIDNYSCTLNLNANHNLTDDDNVFFWSASNTVSALNTEILYRSSSVLAKNQILMYSNIADTAIPLSYAPYLYKYVKLTDTERAAIVSNRNNNVVDTKSILRPVMYDRKSNITETFLNLWDPLQGVLPGVVDSVIKYKSQQDPALYNNSDSSVESWGSEHVGEVWWDLSTCWYIDYYQSIYNADGSIDYDATLEYRRVNWGKTLPGSSIDIYEWVKSPVLPNNWSAYVTEQSKLNKTTSSWTPSGEADLINWSEVQEYDSNKQDYKTYYYFWVKNASTLPTRDRNITIADMTRIITNPSSMDIPWLGAISENTFIVGGIDNAIIDKNTALQIRFKHDRYTPSTVHKEWQLVQEGIDYEINGSIWENAVNSIIGSYTNDLSEVITLEYPIVSLGNAKNKTWFIDKFEARRELINEINQLYSTINVINTSSLYDVLTYADTYVNKYSSIFSIVEYNSELVIKINSPGRFNTNDAVIIDSTGTLPSPLIKSQMYFISKVKGSDGYYRISIGRNASSFLTITDKGAGINSIVRNEDVGAESSSTLDMTTYWSLTDWYNTGYSASTNYVIYDSISTANTNSHSVGAIIKITNSLGLWEMYVLAETRNDNIWEIIGSEKGSVSLNELLYNSDTTNVKRAIVKILDSLYQYQSRLIFSLVRYAHREQKVLDWVFKTSYISITGLERPLTSKYQVSNETFDNIISYFTEVKPYRTKIRTITDSRTSDTDLSTIISNDIDPTDSNVALYKAGTNLKDVNMRFRESAITLVFDEIQRSPDDITYTESEYQSSFMDQFNYTDPLNYVLDSYNIINCPVSVFNGTYNKTYNIPTFSAFNTSIRAIVDLSKGIYINSHNMYLWCEFGKGWVISGTTQVVNSSTVWYKSTDVETPDMAPSWSTISGSSTNISVYLNSSIIKKDNTHYIMNRASFSDFAKKKAIVTRLISSLKSFNITTAEKIVYNSIYSSGTHDLVINIAKLINSCSTLLSSDNIKQVINDGWDIDLGNVYNNAANRIKISVPDSTQRYIDSELNYGFKGVRITNSPRSKLPIGYSPVSDENVNGYYIWESSIYDTFKNKLIASGMTENDALAELKLYGFAGLVPYVPYINDLNNVPITNSIFVTYPTELGTDLDFGIYIHGGLIKPNSTVGTLEEDLEYDTTYTRDEKSVESAETYNSLNDIEYDKNNPLQNDYSELDSNYAADVYAFDNLGYDKSTKSITYSQISNRDYVYDISELDLDSTLGNLRISISNYKTDQADNVDFGIYLIGNDNLIKPGSTLGSLEANYLKDAKFAQSDDGLYEWDFGRQYGVMNVNSAGAFTVEATCIKDPQDSTKVVISAPRTIKQYILDWKYSNTVYTSAERVLYPFSIDTNRVASTIRIGNHSLVTGDTVMLLANDSMTIPNGAVFNDSSVLYTVKVLSTTTISLLDSNNNAVILNPSNVQTDEYNTSLLYSLFNVVKPQVLNDITIDCQNYPAIYNRVLSSCELPNTISISSNNVISANHKLNTFDCIKFTNIGSNTGINNKTVYFVKVINESTFGVYTDILLTNQVQLVDNKISYVIVNYWYSSNVTCTRKNRTWQAAQRSLSSSNVIHNMKSLFNGDNYISSVDDEVVEQGFARPYIDEGSLRDLTRMSLQENLDIVMFQDDNTSKVTPQYNNKGVLMYDSTVNANQYGFIMSYNTADQVCRFNTLDNTQVGTLDANLWYDDNTIYAKFNNYSITTIPAYGFIMIGSEKIKYNSCSWDSTNSRFVFSNLVRGAQYTADGFYYASGYSIKLLQTADSTFSTTLSRITPISSTYDYASNCMYSLNGTKTVPVKTDTSTFAVELKANTASYSILK